MQFASAEREHSDNVPFSTPSPSPFINMAVCVCLLSIVDFVRFQLRVCMRSVSLCVCISAVRTRLSFGRPPAARQSARTECPDASGAGASALRSNATRPSYSSPVVRTTTTARKDAAAASARFRQHQHIHIRSAGAHFVSVVSCVAYMRVPHILCIRVCVCVCARVLALSLGVRCSCCCGGGTE